MTIWDAEQLWEKTRLYAARAASEEQEGPLFALWSAMAMELLGRTVVANVHPALLADPQNPDNLMYAFGLGQVRKPRSVPARTVFHRCVVIIDDFTDEELKSALALIELRNEELHSGGVPFEGLKTASWLAGYYRVCEVMLRSMDREMADMFGDEQAAAAEQMIAGAAEQLESEVREYIARQARAFTRRDAKEQARLRKAATQHSEVLANEVISPHQMGNVVACPACETDAWMTGDFVRLGEPVADEDAIVQEVIKIPTRLECFACGLEIVGHGRLHAIGLGGLFAKQFREDPASYFDIEFDPSEYYEPDYGNE